VLARSAPRAERDPLTGAGNREGFERSIEARLNAARGVGRDVLPLYRDCNGFKPIDDTHGRDPGNAIICPLALRLRLRLAVGDALARWISEDDLPRLETCACLRARLGRGESQQPQFIEGIP
jgi:GGDEF domain-containing protein